MNSSAYLYILEISHFQLLFSISPFFFLFNFLKAVTELSLISTLPDNHISRISCKCQIPHFGVSAVFLNSIDVSCRWCKLNFWPLQVQVKSRHFPRRRDAGGQYLYFLYKFIRIIGTKQLVQLFWIMNIDWA